jgi:hypothetical protein
MTEKFFLLIKAGNYIECAAPLVGVTKNTIYEWCKQGVKDKAAGRITQCSQFNDLVESAHAEAEARDVMQVSKLCESGSLAALGWRLERKFPQRWGRRAAHSDLEIERMKIEMDLMRAKLKMLEAGTDPDSQQQINVIIPAFADPNKSDE